MARKDNPDLESKKAEIISAYTEIVTSVRSVGLYPMVKRGIDLTLCALSVPIVLVAFLPYIIYRIMSGYSAFIDQDVFCGRRGKKIGVFSFSAQPLSKSSDAFDVVPSIYFSIYKELPKIYSVFIGDMSWVGPRLVGLNEHRYWEIAFPYSALRASVRPGVVGLAMVNANVVGSTLSFDEIADDLEYVKSMSLSLDSKILYSCAKMKSGCAK